MSTLTYKCGTTVNLAEASETSSFSWESSLKQMFPDINTLSPCNTVLNFKFIVPLGLSGIVQEITSPYTSLRRRARREMYQVSTAECTFLIFRTNEIIAPGGRIPSIVSTNIANFVKFINKSLWKRFQEGRIPPQHRHLFRDGCDIISVYFNGVLNTVLFGSHTPVDMDAIFQKCGTQVGQNEEGGFVGVPYRVKINKHQKCTFMIFQEGRFLAIVSIGKSTINDTLKLVLEKYCSFIKPFFIKDAVPQMPEALNEMYTPRKGIDFDDDEILNLIEDELE